MQVKIFEAEDMATGLKMIRNELGADALILSTRSIRNGKLGILGKPRLEITAAIDKPLPSTKNADTIKSPFKAFTNSSPKKQQSPTNSFAQNGYNEIIRQNINLTVDETIEPISYEKPVDTQSPKSANYAQQTQNDYQDQLGASKHDENISSELGELKDLVKNLAKEVSRISTSQQQEIVIPSQHLSPILQAVQNNILPENAIDNPVIEHLLNLGINLETSSTIADFTKDNLTDDIIQVPEKLSAFMQSTISSLIQTQSPSFENRTEQKRIALVGPTGVGKTTTLAKLAARFLSKHSNSIALITIDTYRIAAVEQLKVYGEIMNLPVDVVITPQELEQAIMRHQDKELILIDTAGRSPRDTYCIDELSSFLVPHLDIQKHLVLSSTTRENEIISTINQFDKIGIDHTIMTKIDECSNLGVLLNIQIQNPNPISFITNGQRVPEDIIEADQQLIAELIMSNTEG